MTPNISLYRVNGACSLVPHAILRHLSLPFTSIVLKAGPDRKYMAADGSFTHAEFRSINPSGYIPVLRVDEDFVSEIPVIIATIVQLAPNQELLGRNLIERARVAEWMTWLSGTVHGAGFGAYWRPYRFVEDLEEAYPFVKAKGRKVIEESFERIERRLKGKRFAVGEALTTVDFHLYLFARWGGQIGFKTDERYPSYASLALTVEKLDAVRETIAEEGLEFTFAADGSYQIVSA